MAAERPTLDLNDEMDVALPDGAIYRIRPGPYGKGITLQPIQPPRRTPRGKGTGKRGRRPREGTVKLRDRLAKDAAKGKVREAPYYVDWLTKEDPTVSLSTARQIVYRERRNALKSVAS